MEDSADRIMQYLSKQDFKNLMNELEHKNLLQINVINENLELQSKLERETNFKIQDVKRKIENISSIYVKKRQIVDKID